MLTGKVSCKLFRMEIFPNRLRWIMLQGLHQRMWRDRQAMVLPNLRRR